MSVADFVPLLEPTQQWNGPYLQSDPRDPWDNEYEYRVPGNDDRDFDVWSNGRDGQEGGEGADAEINCWT